MRRRGGRITAIAGALIVLLAGCAPPAPPQPSTAPVPAPEVSASSPGAAPSSSPTIDALVPRHAVGEPATIATGLEAPWDVVFWGDIALISERDSGVIREVMADGTTRVAGAIDGVVHGGEGGLLGLAVDDSALFVYSTGADGNRVQRYALTGTAGSVALGEMVAIIDAIPSARNHNGGRIAIGPDGLLYIATGDASQSGTSQDPASLAGKILRLTTDGAVAPGNPFGASPVYSLGHRNVQGLAWAADGTMFASEFGQNTWDELNIITPGGNYGWPAHEGLSGTAGFIDPVQVWATDAASPSGLAVAGGTIFVANLRGGMMREIPVADPSTAVELYAGVYGRLRDVEVAPDGALWIITNNADGRGDPRDGDDRVLRVELDAR